MNLENKNKINQLLLQGVHDGLYFSEWLKKNGYSDQLTKKYRESGWLSSLDKGVLYRTGSKLSAYAALFCFNEQMKKNYHVAAHSALELMGFNHYVPMGKPFLMVSHPKEHQPQWMKSNLFDKTFKLFSTETFSEQQIVPVKLDDLQLLTSTPEQAFLECLLLAPMQYNYLDLYYIMEQLTTLRVEIIQKLLETTKNFKVKRMFMYMSEKAGHNWMNALDISKVNFGTSKLQLVDKGVYIAKYKIVVPQDLYDYE